MPARVPNAAGHTLTLEDDAATGGPLTNSGARTAGGLENIGTATSNTFTMTEVIKIKETVNVPASTPPVPGTTDGLETAAGPVIKVKSITLPSSYQGDTLSFFLYRQTVYQIQWFPVSKNQDSYVSNCGHLVEGGCRTCCNILFR